MDLSKTIEKMRVCRMTDVESMIAEFQLGNCCIADRNENQKTGLNDETPEIQKLIDSSAKFLAELIAKDEE